MPSVDMVYRYLGVDAGAGASMDRMAAKTAALGKSGGLAATNILRLTKVATGVGLVLGGVAVKAAADFQTQLVRIHTQADQSYAKVAQLRKGILAMTTTVATSPVELAKAAYHIASMAQSSLTAAQQLHILKIAAEGAKLGGADLVDVTNALDAAIASGIGGVKNYSQAMGVLNATVGAGDMTMQNLADAFGPLAQVLKNYNVNIRQAGAALATFGDLNHRGAEAGTALRMAVQSLAVPVKAGKDLLKSWGIASGSLADQLRHGGLTAALDTLYQKLKLHGITGKEVGDVLTQAFGKRAGIGLTTLIGQLTRFHNKLGEVSRGANGFASSWKGYTKTFQYSWDRMREAVQKMAIQLGTVLLPAATAIANFITKHVVPALSSFGHFLKRNAEWVKPLGVALAGFAGGLIIVSKALGIARVAAGLFGISLDVALGPVGLIIAGLTAVAAAAIYFYKTSETFRHVVQKVFVDLAWAVGQWAKYNLLALKYVADAMLGFVGTIVHAAASAFGWIPGLGGQLKGAAHAFDGFRASVDSTLSGLANDAGNLGTLAGSLFAWHFMGAANSVQMNAAGYGTKSNSPFRDPGHPGAKAPAHAVSSGIKPPTWNLGGGSGVPIPTGAGGASKTAKAAASALHITAQGLVKALASGLMNGWQGFSLTVEDSLSSGTRNLLNQLQKQFKTVTDGMAKLVKDARTKLANDLKAQTQFVQQMMSDAALSNTPTVDSGYTGQTTRLTSLSTFLGGQAANYALFAKDLKRLSHMGLNKGLFNQIAARGPTQGLQFAQQILSNPAMISQLNSYQKQIATSAKAIGQDRYGSQIQADRRNLHRQTELQERMARRLDHLAHDIGQEVAAAVLTAGKVNGKTAGLTQHEAQQILNALNKLKRRQGK